jgi:hypothetical protein
MVCTSGVWEKIARFGDIGEIDDHHYLNFLFITCTIPYTELNVYIELANWSNSLQVDTYNFRSRSLLNANFFKYLF